MGNICAEISHCDLHNFTYELTCKTNIFLKKDRTFSIRRNIYSCILASQYVVNKSHILQYNIYKNNLLPVTMLKKRQEVIFLKIHQHGC